MALDPHEDRRSDTQSFEREADQPQRGLVREFWAFLGSNKKWWLTPIIVVLLLLGLLVVLGGTAFAPFTYPLF